MAAVNNDGELAIDISESDEMEELLQKEIDAAGIDCEVSRTEPDIVTKAEIPCIILASGVDIQVLTPP